MHSSPLLPSPPENEAELLQRAQRLAGQTFAALAAQLNLPIPPNLKRDKGWVGMLLELHLGASAGSKAEQDFAHLGIELKTIPVDAQGNRWKPPSCALRRLPVTAASPGKPAMCATS